jgi:hypothetical protein
MLFKRKNETLTWCIKFSKLNDLLLDPNMLLYLLKLRSTLHDVIFNFFIL